tara:strand:+ start:1026 stop:1250 length:225 start_codon:yes stop_codon:yes gene_type:complete
MVMQYMIQTSEHYNSRINEVEAQVMELSESLGVLRYNIKELSDTITYELDRLNEQLQERNKEGRKDSSGKNDGT